MKKRGFSLIELAIVLSIIGLIISGSLKAAKVMRENGKAKDAKIQVATAKEAIIGDALIYGTLSTVANFDQNLSPIAGNQKKMFYYPASNLGENDVCAYRDTDLQVVIYKNGTDLSPILDVAFVTASAGANSNLQTGMKKVKGKDTVKYYDYTMKKDDGNDGISRLLSDHDDDVVGWVTLSQLKNDIQCQSSLKLITNFIPKLDINSSKIVPIFTDDDTTTSYTWQAKIANNINTSSYIEVKCNTDENLTSTWSSTHSCSSFVLKIMFTDGETANRVDINVSDSYGNSDIRSYAVSLR